MFTKINYIKNRSKYFRIAVHLLYLLLFSNFSISQNSNNKNKDSLKNKSYEQLYNSFLHSANDTLKTKIYAFAYLNKAKKNKDTIKIAKSYSYLSSLYSTFNENLALKYADSIIVLTKKINHLEYPGYGYLIKGMCLTNLGDYENALNNYFTCIRFAKKNNHLTQLFYARNQIAQIKSLWGKDKEAISIFLNQLSFLEDHHEDFNGFMQLKLNTLFHLSNCYYLEKKYDSALYYSKIGIKQSLTNKEIYFTEHNDFLGQAGELKYRQNKFQEAIDSLSKALPNEVSYNGLLNINFYLGKSYEKMKNEKMAIYHLTKADSIYDATLDIVTEVRGIQEFFINYYKNKGDTEKQLYYIDRLLKVDSILNTKSKFLTDKIHKEYDTPLLLSEKNAIINNLKSSEKKSSFIIILLIGILSFSVFLIVRYYKLQKNYKTRFQKLVQNQERKLNQIDQPTQTIELTGISSEIVESIVLHLDEFEKSNSFLNNSITLNSLSQIFNTNSNYLSRVINFEKKKNFSTYISDLRIEYVIHKLKIDPTFRKFGVKSIANEIGFNNAESFSKAFYKNTGIYPSYFIKELENEA